jgi:MtN3 and saliva related transmembrane protein
MTENLIGIAAGVITGVSMLPQLFKIIKEKDAGKVSISMLIVLTVGLGMWVWYGIEKEDLPIIVTNAFSILVNMTTLALKLYFDRRKHKVDP